VQVPEPVTAAGDSLPVVEEPFQDVEELDIKAVESTDM